MIILEILSLDEYLIYLTHCLKTGLKPKGISCEPHDRTHFCF